MITARKQIGEYADALRYLQVLTERSDNPDYRYEEALLWELQEEYAIAAELYLALLALELPQPFRLNVMFRLGIVQADMGHHGAAKNIFKEIQKNDLKNHEKIILQYAQGVTEIHAGKTRKGVRRIKKALMAANPEAGSWIEARARSALVHVLIEKSEKYTFDRPGKTKKNFHKRSVLVGSAEEQIVVMINLGEPEYVLRSLHQLAEAYLQVSEELRLAPPPPKLDREQTILFQEKQNERADFIAERGRSYCAKGIGYADQTGFSGQIREVLEHCATGQ
jgi:tetratricopeptide (TPR) repeat protein